MEELIKQALVDSTLPFKGNNLFKISAVQGGCIHKAWRLDFTNNIQIFAKSNSITNFKVLKFEYESLMKLREYADDSFLEIPKPIKLCSIENQAILFLPWINFTNDDQFILGKGLALLHKFSHGANNQFGWAEDGFIGSSPQIKGWGSNWGEYFVNFRLKPQMKLASKWGFDINEYQTLFPTLEVFLNEHKPLPSLVHGDLWSGNIAVTNNKGCIFDPASYWADREVDIAMTKLFGGFAKEFYEGYYSTWPLPKNSESREDIYNLYHILNHANLFGGSYKSQAINLLNKI